MSIETLSLNLLYEVYFHWKETKVEEKFMGELENTWKKYYLALVQTFLFLCSNFLPSCASNSVAPAAQYLYLLGLFSEIDWKLMAWYVMLPCSHLRLRLFPRLCARCLVSYLCKVEQEEEKGVQK